METLPVFCEGKTAAMQYTLRALKDLDFAIAESKPDIPCCLLLDVPSFSPDGTLRSGKNCAAVLSGLHPNTVIIGGNLEHPALAAFRKIDLLKDELYLEENAKITAYCALMLAAQALPITLDQANTLVIGWGRIGRVFAKLLKDIGTPVTIAARNPAHLQILRNLGYQSNPLEQFSMAPFRLIINTVPSPVLDSNALSICPDAVKIDLASQKGLGGSDVIHARGLPGIHAPESSGKLIAETMVRCLKEMIL